MPVKSMSRPRNGTIVLLVVGVTLALLIAILLVLSARGIHLSSDVVVSLSREQAWRFFENPQNLARWDRSVARVEPTTTAPVGHGYTFDTIAPPQRGQAEGQRMSYRVAVFEPPERVRIDLVDSNMFEHAQWHVMLEPAPRGTRVVTEVEFVPRPRYFFLTPLLYFSRGNMQTDMAYLYEQMEAFGQS